MKYKPKQPDYILMGLVFVLIIFGLVMISSASAAVAFERFGDSYYFLKRQFVRGVVLGLAAFFITFKVIDYRFYKKNALWFLIITIALLLAVFLPGLGTGLKGAKRWISLGSFTFQPAEFIKLTFLIYLASWFDSKGRKKIKDWSYGFIPFLAVLAFVSVLIISQPDMGTMSIIVLTSLIIFYIAGASWKHLAFMGVGGLAVFGFLIKIAPYRANRFMIFLHPELDPQGIGYHINQAFLAIGSGGFWGRGLGQSRQKFQYLPEVAGDSIFAVIGEELGFLFTVLVVIAFLFLMYRGFKIAVNAPDNFGNILAVGITSWIVLQAFANIMAMTGLMPLTGLPLPFVSYGSSSLIASLAAVGILLNISKQSKV